MNNAGSTEGGSSQGSAFKDKAGYSGGGSSEGQGVKDKAGSTGDGTYSQVSAFYQPEEQVAPGYYDTSSSAALPSGSSNSYPSLPDMSGNLLAPHLLLLVIFNRIHWHHDFFILSIYRVFTLYRKLLQYYLFAFRTRLDYPS